MPNDNTLVHYGSEVKTLEKDGDDYTVGGHLVIFDDPASPVKDLAGDYFTSDTDFGSRKGDGAECLFHHGVPLKSELAHLSRQRFQPLKVEEDEMGLFASTVLDMSDDYQAAVGELVEQKALGWSSGALPHLVERKSDGFLKTWIVGEGSLTPTPCEPRTSAMPLKSLRAQKTALSPGKAEDEYFYQTERRLREAFEEQFDPEEAWWIVDASDSEVIVEMDTSLYRLEWTEEDGEVQFPDQSGWQEVERRVTYVPSSASTGSKSSPLDMSAQALEMQNLTTRLKMATL